MAKVQFTFAVSDVRNKYNGSVFASNRGGSYIRNKKTPTNPQTDYQQNSRSVLAEFSSGWRSLTQSQRDGWNAGAADFPYVDIFGSSRTLSGQQLYVKLNANLTYAGQASITTCPSPGSVPQANIVSVVSDVSSTTVTVTLSDTTVPAGYTLLIFATPCVSPGINFVKNRLRLLGDFVLTAGAINTYSVWHARLGNLVAGQKLFARAVYVNNLTGQVGVATQSYAIITA
jgi:hypothetical protein